MNQERDGYEGTRARDVRRLHESRRAPERENATVAQHDDSEDWPMLTALLAGLMVALLANTFLGLIPG